MGERLTLIGVAFGGKRKSFLKFGVQKHDQEQRRRRE